VRIALYLNDIYNKNNTNLNPTFNTPTEQQLMRERKLTTTYQVYQDINELPATEQQLLLLSKEALKDAYAPYSNFLVGSAVLLQNGEMLGGSNQENASYPLCLCAERVALAAAASQHPKEAVVAIAVTAKSPRKPIEQPITPCGACRQVIGEVEHKHQQDIQVILQGEVGEIFVFKSIKSLLPLLFDNTYL